MYTCSLCSGRGVILWGFVWVSVANVASMLASLRWANDNVPNGSLFDHTSSVSESSFDPTGGRKVGRHPTNSSFQGGAVVAVASATRAWNQTSSIFSCQELKVAQEPPSTLNFLAPAVGRKYEDILPMYVFYALSAHRNIDAVAEIIVPDSKAFVDRNLKALGHLQTTFSSPSHPAFCVRQYMGQPAKRTRVTNT
ncbi:hypothetical protein THAOC_36854 [Thalassiosira oceanica]|uniref:Uncharacterized protein n=1 Tax=Thalassiosira oceanica TaxID=159749 RepID=K0RDJ5_THAOC|nr:hypothetical protein THAOC_36854 [Thalassiosira oceanica]|eukprot:EJK44597.1 hypothetical protein THAOC_36854 [Thalassiosira oceanica]